MHLRLQHDKPENGSERTFGLRAAALAAAALGQFFCAGAGGVLLVLLFYGVVTPAAVVMKLFGKDALRLKPDAAARSYWVIRTPPGPVPGTMNRQF